MRYLKATLISGLLSMKKGFSNFMTSIDSALKQGGPDDASDTFSVYSDVSSDSESFTIIMGEDKPADCMDVMFRYIYIFGFFFCFLKILCGC